MRLLKGKVAIVTGSSSGIGRAIAERLAQDGATVVVNYHAREEKAREVAAGIQASGGAAAVIQADMSRVTEAQRLVQETFHQFHRLDILVNNAGRFIPKKLVETTEAEFDAIVALNAKGPYFAMQAAAKVLSDGGRIVNISSALTHLKFPGATAHLGSKAALEQYGKGLAQELAPRGITVNTVLPGFTDTGVLTEPYRNMGEQLSPFKRLGLPSDVADVVAFLVSEQARWLTGQTIQAGGGIVM
ncbi:MAG: glucose 1-dehydrogenase [Nitrospira sp.]|nr:glucose 1-dehydrogenase [Nitrospira sp.]MBP6604820.1 glucose 1-dehydrogenase [Nitrospira sp.]HQY57092.1 glucose 1-dehydrogenase [Nitrospira sp.]HRA97199.1 glucose 1-dehydrogenase [Nitrospira sp.]